MTTSGWDSFLRWTRKNHAKGFHGKRILGVELGNNIVQRPQSLTRYRVIVIDIDREELRKAISVICVLPVMDIED